MENKALQQQSGWQKAYYTAISILCYLMCALHIINFIPQIHIKNYSLVALTYMFGMLMCYLIYNFRGKAVYWNSWKTKVMDLLLAAGAVFVCFYVIYDVDAFLTRIQLRATSLDMVVGMIAAITVLEACRRLTGPALPVIALVSILYALLGGYLPGPLHIKGYSLNRVMRSIIGNQGILGSAMTTVTNTVFAFLLFGAFLNVCGANDIFRDLSIALAGKKRGGPAKMAVIASCIFGSISGSPISNVASTGAFTIPLMKKTGYRSEFAGAVEAVASTGGQIMPPVMGAAAFLLAEFTGISYATVCLAALVPALMYYICLFKVIDCEALRVRLMGLSNEEIPPLGPVLKRSAKLLIPIAVLLIAMLVLGRTAARSAFYATISVIICSLLDKEDRFTFRKLLKGFEETAKSSATILAACGCAGIITAMLSLTGLGLTFSNFIFRLGSDNLFLSLVFAMLVSIILGMGLPTTVAYIVTATSMSAAFTKMGLTPLAAHMFLLYFACMSNITPPVAIAAYTGAALAEAPPMKVGVQSVRLGIVGFIVPYIFIYNPLILGWDFSSFPAAMDTVQTLIGAVMVAWPMAYCMSGFTYKKLSIWERLFNGALALLLILPYWYINVPFMVVTLLYILRTSRKEKEYELTYMRTPVSEHDL